MPDPTDAPQEPDSSSVKEEKSLIPEIISDFTRRIRAIRNCAVERIQFDKEADIAWIQSVIDEAFTRRTIHSEEEEGGTELRISIGRQEVEKMSLGLPSVHASILLQSLLIFGFSTFDAFLGNLLRQLYREVPKLIHKVEQKEIKVGELVDCKSLDEAVEGIIDRDISSLLRSSYSDLFSTLANRHGISTLKKFPAWPDFIEAAQRRNLITHCSGVVNSQYIEACEKSGFQLDAETVNGVRLGVNSEYLRSALDILYEVGVKLGHILWRTAAEDKIGESEIDLTNEIFHLLQREEWELAKTIGEFAVNIRDKKNELQSKISRINYAQALKWSGDDARAIAVLEAVDWTSSIRDLRLGVEVLKENFDKAAGLMKEIGKEGELVVEEGYRAWPVFREFRKTTQFKDAFKDIYGLEFTEPEHIANQSSGDGVEPCSEAPSPDIIQITSDHTGDDQMPAEKPVETEVEKDEDANRDDKQ